MGGRVTLCHTQGTADGVCNYLALEKTCGMLILRIRAFSPPELQGLYVYLKNYLTRGGGGGGGSQWGILGTQGPPPPATPLNNTVTLLAEIFIRRKT